MIKKETTDGRLFYSIKIDIYNIYLPSIIFWFLINIFFPRHEKARCPYLALNSLLVSVSISLISMYGSTC